MCVSKLGKMKLDSRHTLLGPRTASGQPRPLHWRHSTLLQTLGLGPPSKGFIQVGKGFPVLSIQKNVTFTDTYSILTINKSEKFLFDSNQSTEYTDYSSPGM